MISGKNILVLSVVAALLCGGIWWFVAGNKPQTRNKIATSVVLDEIGLKSAFASYGETDDPTHYIDLKQNAGDSHLEPHAPPITDKQLPELEDAILDEYLFKFYNENDRRAFEEYARTHGIKIIDSLAVGNVVRVEISDRKILDELLRNGPVAIDSMPNTYVRVPERDDNVPLTPPTEGHHPFGDRALDWLGIKDNANWGRSVLVAILDSGVNASGALSGKHIMHLDFINEASHLATHGTAVASILAGRDLSGVAPAADLISIKVMSDAGTGDAFTLAKGIIEATDRGAQIINMSLGSNSDSFIVRDAIAYAMQRGVLLVAAAGNDAHRGLLYPARYENVIAVAGVDFQGEHLYFSNRGAEVDLAAPAAGVAVVTATGETAGFSGTSVASPFVAGTVAELLARNPNLSTEDIRKILVDYSNDAGAPGLDELYGAGILDVDRINSRNKSGIYDMAAMRPFVENGEKGTLTIHISAQNRGTETIAEVILKVDFQGKKESFQFFNIQPGNTISQPFIFSQPPTSGIEMRFSVNPIGVNDATPNNNAILSIINPK